MSKWRTYKLGELVTIKGGKRLPKGVLLQSAPNHHPYIRIRDLGKTRILELDSTYEYVDDITQKSIARYVVEKGDILLSIVGTIGLIGIVGESLHLANQTENCVKLINLNKVDRLYLYYYLSSKIGQIEIQKGIVGAVQAKLPIKNIENIEISLPPLAEQKRIADILSAIDDKIELNRRINANLEQQAQALYKSWFVDFEPWGGVMPKDWREGTISDIVDLLNGFAFKSSDFVEKGLYKLITIKGVQDGNMSLNGADCLDIIPPKMPQWCKLKKEDILLSLTGNVGRCCLVDTENCLLNQRVAKLHPKEEYNRLFVYALFRQEDMKARMISIARGTAQMNLSPIETGKLPLIIPSNEVLKDFGNRFNNIIHTLTNNIVESSYLAQLRDTLLPKLMSGEITV